MELLGTEVVIEDETLEDRPPLAEGEFGFDEDFTSESTNVVPLLAPGSFFADRFRIESALGTGALSAVFRALDLQQHEKAVALKVLIRRRGDDEARDRFAREQQILSRLEHPGIISIHAFGHAGDIPWIAMELVEGETLGERVRREGRLQPEELVPIVDAACDALQAAHDAGVVHRDLKPDHIYLPSQGYPVRILDFGLSAAVNTKKLTATNTILGTPRYMAPEQIASAKNAGPAADIYSLGVIIYEALAGASPFAASDQGKLLGAILYNRIEPLESVCPDLPMEMGGVLSRAMSKETSARFATPAELADAFADSAGVRVSQPRFSLPPGGIPSFSASSDNVADPHDIANLDPDQLPHAQPPPKQVDWHMWAFWILVGIFALGTGAAAAVLLLR